MESGSQEQILLLLQAILPGIAIGVLFESHNGVMCRSSSVPRTFCLDVLWGCSAALITFCAALALTDGQMHPVLLLGLLLGFLAERYTIGRLLRWAIEKAWVGMQCLILWCAKVLGRCNRSAPTSIESEKT